MKTNFDDVRDFHAKFGLDLSIMGVGFLPKDLEEFRLKFLKEELQELEEAYERMDLPAVADALVDIVYVAMGTADLHNFPWQKLWDEVQRANMSKERAAKEDDSTRGSTWDVVKPEGWTPPNIRGILEEEIK